MGGMSDAHVRADHCRSPREFAWWLLLSALMSVLCVMSTPRGAFAQISPGPLARAHKSLEGSSNCVQCHSLSRAPMSTSCLNCHKDVKSMIDSKTGYHARIPGGQRLQCESCHPDHAGVDFSLIAWPGENRARFDHRQTGWALEGKHVDAKCESCHTTKFRTAPVAALSKRLTGTPWIGLEQSCVSCHQRDDAHDGALKAGCDKCHDAKKWDAAPKFNHADARYQLTGKHSDVKCDACHQNARLPLKVNAKGEKLSLFRPIAFARCSDCHADPHKGRIRQSCTTCHETTGWETIDKKGFNHGATRYPLQGKHARVPCASCHGRENERPTPAFATCASCHADVHRGEAEKTRDCASCHVLDGFAPATFTVAEHAKTGYALEGKHATVSCASCHTTEHVTPTTTPGSSGMVPAKGFVRLKMAATSCAGCHLDAHGGQAVVRAAANSCAACHTVNGFAPSTTTVASHASFKFALTGAHATAACAACHGVARKGLPALTVAAGKAKFAFALADTSCVSCHADPHAGRYSAGGARTSLNCMSCHTTGKFRPSAVTTDAHKALGYALEGAHRTVACAECHKELSAPSAKSSLRLAAVGLPAMPFTQSRSTNCVSCHTDVHNAQFSRRKDRGACEGCHSVSRFSGADRFDHDKQTKFALAGAHAKVACARCHAVIPGANSATPESARRQYAGVSTACETCHTAKQTEAR